MEEYLKRRESWPIINEAVRILWEKKVDEYRISERAY
jgi:hypothetical protein